MALIGATHFSLCTGGLVSATAALASNFAPEMSRDQLMTRAEPQDFVCISMSVDREAPQQNSDTKGCGEGSACMDQAHQSITEAASFVVLIADHLEYPPAQLLIGTPVVRSYKIAAQPPGPPLFNARNHADILVKRE